VSADIASTNSTRILPGGAWCPSAKCRHQQSLAIVIPFRDRWRQLRNLLSVLHPMLQRQQSGCYRVFVVEQYGGGAFNKGRLNNAGFLEAMRRHNFTCVIFQSARARPLGYGSLMFTCNCPINAFQDTDIVPENDRNPYLCGSVRPRHLAVAVDTNRYRLPYAALVGGVIAFTTRHFFRVNGYSNLYWGWGLEDDDMELRMKIGTKLKYERPPASVARFKALPHASQRIYRLQASRRMPLLKTALQRYSKDGLNTVKYRVLFSSNEPLFTHLLIDIGEQPLDFELTGTE
uniref:Glyco_transf_7C domain-containing protein n=1 Tax=Macrostomum lignano TaxID=282301 RepID=A0A1I8HUT0_9PLAT